MTDSSTTNNSSASDVDPVIECARLGDQSCHVQTTITLDMLISSLPTEILCKIFVWIRDTHDQTSFGTSWVNSTSHVCHHWRTVAINCAELWSQITFDGSSEWLQLQLQRVKKFPLTVDGFSRNRKNNSNKVMLAWMRQNPDQLQSFTMTRKPTPIRKYANALRGVHAPFLELLELEASKCRDSDPIDKKQHLPPDLLSKGAPSLQVLCLRHVLLPFSSPIFKGLRSLTVETAYSPIIILAEFFDALASCPNLEFLEVKFAFKKCLSYDSPTPHAVVLPKVTTFSLKGTMSNCTAILEHLILPISKMLQINIIDEHTLDIDSDQSLKIETQHQKFCAAIQQALLSNPLTQTDNNSDLTPGFPDIRSMEYREHSGYFNSRPEFYLEFSPNPASDFVYHSRSTDSGSLIGATLSIRPQSVDSTVFAHYLIKYFDILLQNVTVAIFNTRQLTPLSLKVWLVVAKFPLLRCLGLKEGSARAFFEQVLLKDNVDGDTDTNADANTLAQASPTPFDNFRHITQIIFHGVDFGLGKYGYYFNKSGSRWNESPHKYIPVYFDQHLMRFLRLRAKDGVPIEMLGLRICDNVNDTMLEEVRGVVENVRWDGVVRMISDEDFTPMCVNCGFEDEECRCGSWLD